MRVNESGAVIIERGSGMQSYLPKCPACGGAVPIRGYTGGAICSKNGECIICHETVWYPRTDHECPACEGSADLAVTRTGEVVDWCIRCGWIGPAFDHPVGEILREPV